MHFITLTKCLIAKRKLSVSRGFRRKRVGPSVSWLAPQTTGLCRQSNTSKKHFYTLCYNITLRTPSLQSMIQTTLIQSCINKINQLGRNKTPFFFMIDFEMKKPIIYPLDELPDSIRYNLNGKSNHESENEDKTDFKFNPKPIGKKSYSKAFKIVKDHLQYGNTFLLNLAFPSEVETDLSIKEIYDQSEAKYKLQVKDELVVFSPETFIKIKNDYIYSYPMKGTIDAEALGADLYILNDRKETAEHCTIVDLIRNDLSMVAKEVRVTKFRYIDTLKTNIKSLHQVSSEIRGKLSDDYHERLGDILFKLLPAGSVSGAPKPKTLEIIKEAELQDRGYYTGVFGVYDGETLDSGVMIRYIEKNEEGKLQYRSGGGITAMSDLDNEYQELIDKIYVPTYRKHQDFQWPYLQSTET